MELRKLTFIDARAFGQVTPAEILSQGGVIMSVKIIIERKFKVAPDENILKNINELRMLAMREKGYISGETLVNTVDNREVVVVSVWATLDDWTDWSHNKRRHEVEKSLADDLSEPAQVRCFTLGPDYLKKAFAQFVHDSDAEG